MAVYITAARLSDWAPGAAKEVAVGGNSIALFNVGGDIQVVV